MLLWLGCLAAVLLVPAPAGAQDDVDGQVWLQMLALGELSPTWRSHLEVQPRVMDNASELGLTLVRTAIGRQLGSRTSVWVGHAWVPRTLGEGVRHEQRVWQQALVTGPRVGAWVTSTRVRVEQRWLDPWVDTSHRLRVLERVQRSLGASARWSVAAYDELMVTLDDTARGPGRGYDRNRFYAAVGRRVVPRATLETGFIWENSTVRPGATRNDYAAIAVLTVAAPRR